MNSAPKNKKIYLWGLSDIGEGFIAIVSTTYLAYFLTDVAMLPLSFVSVILLVTSIFDFITAPSLGGIIASGKAMKWGRLRSWILICPPIAAIFYILHFISFPGQNLLSAFVIILCYFMARIAYNFVFAANISLLNVVTAKERQGSRLSSQRMVGSNIGRMLGNYLTPILAAYISLQVSDRWAYPLLMIIPGVYFIISNLIQFWITKGYEDDNSCVNAASQETLSLKKTFASLKKNPHLVVTLLIDMTSNACGLVLPTLAVYYYKYVSETPQLVPTHMLLVGLGGMSGALLVRIFGTRIKKYKTYLLTSYMLMMLCLLSIKFTNQNAYIYMGISIFIHMLAGTTQPFELNLYMDNEIYHRWKTGLDVNSLIMGTSALPIKFTNIIKGALIPLVLSTAGFVAGAAPTPQLKEALTTASSLIPAAIPLLGFILLKFFYKLSDDKIAKMKLEILEREKNKNKIDFA